MQKLKLTYKKAFQLLTKWSHKIQEDNPLLKIYFSEEELLGIGQTVFSLSDEEHQIIVGVEGLLKKFPNNYRYVQDNDFIRAGVVLFHEKTHYERHMHADTNPEILISEMSKYKNRTYYAESWSELPHEIDAEFSGISSMWNVLKKEFPKEVDDCMLHFLENRALHTDYMIKCPKQGFLSRNKWKTHLKMLIKIPLRNPGNSIQIFSGMMMKYQNY